MKANTDKVVNILGIRGLPAAHGGFETFAGELAPFLRDQGWKVNVYCQLDPDEHGHLQSDFEDDWEGIHRIHLGVRSSSSRGTIAFDWRSIVHAARIPAVNLVLGYNTAIFSALLRIRGRPIIMNMDGVEWKRAKWSLPVKFWFYFNEFVGANIVNTPIADHPEIARHLRRHGCKRAVVIPYGSHRIDLVPEAPILEMGLASRRYLVSIARIEPENSILEIVKAFSSKPRGVNLVVLGSFRSDNPYHQQVKASASSEVIFPGAIYDKSAVASLRYHALAYMHGHQVGGTNPSLVEALGAGNAIIAHDNNFNRWVAGAGQLYFKDEKSCSDAIEAIVGNTSSTDNLRSLSRVQHIKHFSLEDVNLAYMKELDALLGRDNLK